MIHATVRYYPNQANANGTRGVWRVLHCHEINYVPFKRAYVILWDKYDRLAMRVQCDRMYKKGSRVDPRKMLGLKALGTLPPASGPTLTFRRYSPAFERA